ncbi:MULTISPECIES: FAD-binding oxidoreductase [unclassified Ectothiorhodospira]|uniref:NAD(P)/FAD-dependent oxidoreductase n=1 Tax=unclassified Ectothiorhodospira TaxID=2684909 RepID=UPI001EE8ACAE|nr:MULTISPECIES: FAD-dependent oxidoreductase [unclassified Ectothiorhodospira]MCG5516184.1 FAD-dependent oxidoreductase [Ectothiorhodospira sp. 9100]MCG5519588.1 FAD-dependent oxidoreductase [Ectothiorhodospira sp. 9905]
MTDCIVVGGGLIGMLSARMLHDQGLDVTLLDRQEPGQEASWAGGGILSPLYPWRFPDPVTKLASLTQASTTEAAAQTFHAAAARLVPALVDLPIEKHWAGLRPGSPQGIPYIGPHPEVEGLFVNAGHYRNGVVMSIGACRLLTDLIMGQSPICDPSPYRIDRGDFPVRRHNAN